MGSFLCWKDSRLATVAGIGITLGLSLLYLHVTINLWTVSSYYIQSITKQMCNGIPNIEPCKSLIAVDGTINIMAVGLIMEILCILVSAIALYGIAKDRKSLLIGWIIFMPIYICYELATVIIMIMNVNDLTTGGQSLPTVFSVFTLMASGPAAAVMNARLLAASVTSSPSIGDVSSSFLPFIVVMVFWFLQIIINVVNEAAAVNYYRSDSSDQAPFNEFMSRPPAKAQLMYPAAYSNPAAYVNPAVYPTVRPTPYSSPSAAYNSASVPVMSRPYVTPYLTPYVTMRR